MRYISRWVTRRVGFGQSAVVRVKFTMPINMPPSNQPHAETDPSLVTLTVAVTSPSRRTRCWVCGQPFAAVRQSAKTCSDVCRQALSRMRRAATPPLPEGPFDLILADPPWRFETCSDKGQGRSASRHYDLIPEPRSPPAQARRRQAKSSRDPRRLAVRGVKVSHDLVDNA
jgi:hypothetical protein